MCASILVKQELATYSQDSRAGCMDHDDFQDCLAAPEELAHARSLVVQDAL
jgi:hypothetical protein